MNRRDLVKAARTVAARQSAELKSLIAERLAGGESVVCGISGKPLEDDYEIHHDGLGLSDLFNKFLEQSGVNPDHVLVVERPDGRKTFVDPFFRSKWLHWHKQNAVLIPANRSAHDSHHGESKHGERLAREREHLRQKSLDRWVEKYQGFVS